MVDVGVYDGTEYLLTSFPDAKYILIDPLQEKLKAATQLYEENGVDVFAIPKALDSQSGYQQLNVMGSKTSSVFTRGISQTFPSITGYDLIDLLKSESIDLDNSGTLLKIDTEGSELTILESFAEKLFLFEFIILEIRNHSVSGCPTFYEVTRWMQKKCFYSIGIIESNVIYDRSNNRRFINRSDVLFTRSRDD